MNSRRQNKPLMLVVTLLITAGLVIVPFWDASVYASDGVETPIIPIVRPCNHKMVKTEAVEATCTDAGNIEYYTCGSCGKVFADESGATQLKAEDLIVSAKGHEPGDSVRENEVEPAVGKAGSYDVVVRCKACGVELSRETMTVPALSPGGSESTDNNETAIIIDTDEPGDTGQPSGTDQPSGTEQKAEGSGGEIEGPEVIIDPAPGDSSSIDLPDDEFGPKTISEADVAEIKAVTYSGKSKKPVPFVVVEGKTLKSGTDYTVAYKNNKSVGTATVTITGKGNYKGSVVKTFEIKPLRTSFTKATSKKTSVTLKWKRRTKKMSKSRISGYQIIYSTSKSFDKNSNTVKVKGYKATSKTIKKLKPGKKYYFKIRTYKVISGKYYYSNWSKIKSIKTKK